MGSCIKDLYEYDLVKNCSKWGTVKLKSNFYKNKEMSDGSYERCIFHVNQRQNQYDIENRIKKKEKIL